MTTSRWAASSSAVLITVLTMAGALGLGPVAAMGETVEARSLAVIAEVHDRGAEPAGDSVGVVPSDSRAGEAQTEAEPDAAQPEAQPDGAEPGEAQTEARPDAQPEPQPEAQTDDWLTIDQPPVRDSDEQAGPSQPTSTELPAKSGAGKRIVFDESAQRVWLVAADDRVVRTYLVSGAKDEDLLKPGSYHVYSKSRDAISYNLKETMNYMVRFTAGENAAIGFHDLPAYHDGALAQSRDELGTPLSAGCVRQWVADARALWEFAPVDTLVVVIP